MVLNEEEGGSNIEITWNIVVLGEILLAIAVLPSSCTSLGGTPVLKSPENFSPQPPLRRHRLVLFVVSQNLGNGRSTMQGNGLKSRAISTCVVASNAPHRFRKDVEFLMEMGFDPSLSLFEYAVHAKGCLTESGWEDRLKFFRSLGFSNEETIYMFKKQPLILSTSKEKIRAAVEFYISTFHWSPTQLSKKPSVLRYSLGKRIIPRCSVLQILASRSMINKSVMVSSLVAMAERDFLEKYITNYKDEVPELLDAYHGKLSFDEYNFDS
ncbi:hypothetical protein Vadar_033846 [Vaccinium darrowii]|uniref:Uncharacterized protein n=1 Tax=Vaccinium darrowii TaxID=229202 RepID=A0ACB7XV48_9ERIC|nr:hypothetical protein Vadar_033846 [Vaccinium darrowii]